MIKADIIVDLQYGDCAKGKVSHHLAKERNYTHVLRYNGGCNAGHTIFHEGKKFVTHHIPAGVFFGVKSIIGPGCVLDVTQFNKEIAEIEAGGVDTKGKIFVAKNTHIISDTHKEEDGETGGKLGTTKRGNGQAYRDKYARIGIRAESIPELESYLVDMFDELHRNEKDVHILCEGAQGFGLDIDWGDYPYVTSSHCTVAGALLNGIPYAAINEVWGVAKMYETYAGKRGFEFDDDPVFEKIAEAGEELGATTGRPRQCGWIELGLLERAIKINGVTNVVFSKVDVLRVVDTWKIRNDGSVIDLKNETDMKTYLVDKIKKWGIESSDIHFSEHKDKI